jgi:thiol-disulfide isomerase/thioredoxin
MRRWVVALLALLPGCAPKDEFDRPTVLIFVATDCPLSNKYAPEIARLSRHYGGRLDFHTVYAAGADVAAHQRSYGKPCEAIVDVDGRLRNAARIQVTPEAAIFLPKRGFVYRGRIDDRFPDIGIERSVPTTHDLEDALKAVLRNKVPPAPAGRAVGCPVSG